MSHHKPAAPLTGEALTVALAKTAGIAIFWFVLMASLTLPSMIEDGVGTAALFCVTFQLVMTTICVGGWFVLFMAFDKHLGDQPDQH